MTTTTTALDLKTWNGAHHEQRQHWLDAGAQLDEASAAALDFYLSVHRGNWQRGVSFKEGKGGTIAVTHDGVTIAELTEGRAGCVHAWFGPGSARLHSSWLGIYAAWPGAMRAIWSAAGLDCPPMTPERAQAFIDAAGPRRRQDLAMAARCKREFPARL